MKTLLRRVWPAAVFLLLVFLGMRFGWRPGRARLGELSAPLKKGPISESVYGIGTVTATKSYQLKLGVTATIRKLDVREGDRVRRGQTLVEVDGPVALPAPFDGTVVYLPVKIGETVFPQSVILSLADLRDRYIVVSLEQRGAIRVRQDQKARISFDGMRSETFSGTVRAVYSNENNFLVRIDVDDLPPQVLPGMTADVAIGISEPREALLLPVAAIEGGKVFVDRGRGGPRAVEVKTGIVDGAEAEVVSGELRAGDRVYLRGKEASP